MSADTHPPSHQSSAPASPEPADEAPTPEVLQAADDALRIDPLKLDHDQSVVRARFWRKLKETMARIPFVRDLLAAFYAATDPATPFQAKAVLMGALAYFIAPIDAMPDFIALLGYTDDATVLLLALKTVRDAVKPEHYDRARAWLSTAELRPARPDEIAGGPVIDHEPVAPSSKRARHS